MTAVTLGTGVGGGIILNGRILEGDNGAAGELGHMVIHQNGHPCTCGRKGCLEAYASAAALVSRAREAMERSDESMLWSLCKGDLSGVNGRMIFEASEKGDSTACEVLDGFMEDLSEGIANIINILQPEILCIGGGLSGAGEALLAPVKEKTAPKIYSRASQKNTRILLAELGNGAGIIGAACLNEQR
jgi:glucokinase